MAGARLANVLCHLSKLVASRRAEDSPDQELLTRFVRHGDDGAFAALMERHGAMVLGVCARVLRNGHDAEDACQAAFLVLARRAHSLRKCASLGGWLHGVAWRVARKLQARLARRHVHEASAAAVKPTTSEPDELTWREVRRLVDEELERLPQSYKAPLVLCHLEGRTQDEAARELGWTLGVLRGRLERGRDKLRSRLARRGVTGAAILAGAACAPTLSSAAMPPTLVIGTVNASVAMARGLPLPAAVPAHVAALARTSVEVPLLAKVFLVLATGAVLFTLAAYLGLVPQRQRDILPQQSGPMRLWPLVRQLDSGNLRPWSVAFSPDGKWIACGSGGPGEIKLCDVATGQVLYAIPTPRAVRCVAFAPDGKTLATAEHDGRARLRDAGTGQVRLTLQGHASNIDSVAFAPDSKTLATSSWDKTVKLWDTATGQVVRTLSGHTNQVFTTAFNPVDGTLASGGADGTARIWRPATGERVFVLKGHRGVVHWVAFSPDGKLLATASWDKSVKLWDAATGTLAATLYGHTEKVLAVAFSPDGQTLASSSGKWDTHDEPPQGFSPGEVIVWDVPVQRIRARLRHKAHVFSVAFSPDGTLASTDWDGGVTLWRRAPFAGAVAAVGIDLPADKGDVAASDEAPRLRQHYSHEYKHALQGSSGDDAGFLIYGVQTDPCVKAEPEGLRITLPTGYPGQRPGTGLVTTFGVKGDFEITAGFEILQEPAANAVGAKTDLSLVVVPMEVPELDVWCKTNQNRASLSREAEKLNHLSRFLTTMTRWQEETPRDKWGNDILSNKEVVTTRDFPTGAKVGRLRLVREGTTLFFFVAEGATDAFTLLHKDHFGAKDLKNVRVLGSTGGPKASLDVRLTGLHIRAEGFSKPPASQPAEAATRVRRELLLAGVVVGCLIGIGVPLWWHQRRRIKASGAA